MIYSYKSFFQKLYQSQKQQYSFSAQNCMEMNQWQQKFRAALFEKLGLCRLEELDGLRKGERTAVLIEEIQEKGYRRRKYVIQTLPDVFMPFFMLIPEGVDEQKPAKGMLAIPAHGANKNTVCGVAETQEENQKIREAPKECYGRELVQQGYVVFCPDPPGYGERVEPISSEDRRFLPGKKRSSLDCSCKDLAQTAEALGFSMMALEIHDLVRLLDFACECGEVKKREGRAVIGCAGFSGGGQYTMWLAALDERIGAAVVSGYIHGYYDSILECHLCPCNYAPDLWKLGDICDICALIAPRPLFIESGIDDVENGPCGISGPEEQVKKISRAYALLDAEKKLRHDRPEGGHQWYGRCYEFLNQNL